MRKIMVAAFISLDGVIQAPGGPDEDPTGGFAHGGWVPPLWEDAIGAAVDEGFSAPYDLLLGRKTYDIFAAHWPQFANDATASDFDALNDDIATTFNRITKYVATHRPDTLRWQGSEALGDDVLGRLKQLKSEDGPDLITQGSSELVHLLFANGLVDTLRLYIFPIILGRGKRLFDAGAMPATFKLTSSTVTPNGVVIASYDRVGEVATGSFAMDEPTDEEIERRKTLS